MAAGLGYIEFATGDVLTAASANGYLASQVVMVFASAAARTSAIASPQEGMISYLKDTNSTEYYSGSAWVAIGAAAAATFVGCQLRKSGDQSISNNTNTAITFDTEDIDTDGFHSNVTNTSRVTIPTGKGGKYLVTLQTRFEANSTGRRLGQLYKNGAIDTTFQFESVPSSSGAVTMGNSFFMNLVATDYIELFSLQTSGGNLNVTNTGVFLGVQFVGA
jgi:hypothetical protein